MAHMNRRLRPRNGYNNSFSERTDYTTNWSWTNTLNYTGTFWKNNRIQILVGTEEKDNYYRQLGGTRTGYASNDPAYRFLSTGRPTDLIQLQPWVSILFIFIFQPGSLCLAGKIFSYRNDQKRWFICFRTGKQIWMVSCCWCCMEDDRREFFKRITMADRS